MEYFVVVIASMLAGIGTGLAGLSAATAMVPLLIVLCPTFQGTHGAYMATAIALASDILGSAVTTAVYAKNKNIDLKHGWLLTVCIISMCAAGSVAAYFTHQQVLGGFSLLLCVAIGIRFLVKPESREKRTSGATVRLSAKEIIVSLFFGLTIGFGTGFFGSGGGMMMLIVFTAMLGYDRRTAVGTSTFIMTFTALIAAVSHILIEPAILVECRDYLLISIISATFFSLISARFANRVKAKTVGLATGGILLSLGLVLVLLNYRDILMTPLVIEALRLSGVYWLFILVFAAALLLLHAIVRIPDYIFRKMLHVVAFTSILPLVFCTESWQAAVLAELIFLLVVIIALRFFEQFPFYSRMLIEKGRHEIITSFIMLFGMMTAMLAIFWGGMGSDYRYIIVASIMAWGPGDAAAAIIGKNFGKHKLSGPHIEGVKSLEGSIAMGVTSFLCTAIVLIAMSPFSLPASLLIALGVAPAAALVELYTKRGADTITVPIAAGILLTAAAFLA